MPADDGLNHNQQPGAYNPPAPVHGPHIFVGPTAPGLGGSSANNPGEFANAAQAQQVKQQRERERQRQLLAQQKQDEAEKNRQTQLVASQQAQRDQQSQQQASLAAAGQGRNDQAKGARAGVFQQGGNDNQNNGAPQAVAVGSNGSAGLSDIQKARKYSFQIERAESKLTKLNDQESALKQQMAAATDPAQQEQFRVQLAGITEQRNKANQRLENKQGKLDKVSNRMASAGVDMDKVGLNAVAVAGVKNNGGKGKKDDRLGTGTGGRPAIGNQGNLVGGANGGRPSLVSLGNKGNGGKKNDGIKGNNGPRPVAGGSVSGSQSNSGAIFTVANNGGNKGNGGKKNDDKPKMGGVVNVKNDSLPTNPPKLVSMGGGGGLGGGKKKK